ncbi:hypothetical protein [Ochrobactrum sp. MC-1LL]|uniref:hypothetical protein n=1 Tax=Ochrobactrum sp. MC-1LL TaxID=2735351 RepID=UPI00143842AA|nr:hypothetical protein [Ochrobactrum sp. MC-1LL]NKE77546.1 hypothetical protein [Ochrobactrum sp. MC-1LL]
MKVEIRDGTLRDICFVAANLRDQDRREILATALLESGSQAGAMSFLTSPGFCWTAWIDGQPVAAFGVSQGSPYQPHIRYGWLYGRDQTRRCIPAITRFCLTEWPKRLISEGVTRVEVRSLDGHDLADKWLRSCRAHHEAKMKNYGINGEDFNLYAWLADDWKDSL